MVKRIAVTRLVCFDVVGHVVYFGEEEFFGDSVAFEMIEDISSFIIFDGQGKGLNIDV